MNKLLLLLLVAPLSASALVTGTVHAQATHGFLFHWEDPVEREDGTPLSVEELDSFRLQCISDQESAETLVPIGDTDVNEDGERFYWWDEAVQRGGWYTCSMTAIDENQLESEWSDTAEVRRIAIPRPPAHLRGR